MKKLIYVLIVLSILSGCNDDVIYKDIIEVEDSGIRISINESVINLSNDDTTNISYSETTNTVSVSGTNTSIIPNSILILDLDTAGVIRKVVSVDSIGNQTVCETEQATMEDVFGEANFKLSTSLIQPETPLKNLKTNEEISKVLTDENGFIHPVQIIYHTKDGKIVKSLKDGIDGQFGDNLYTYKDFTGKELYKNDVVNFYISEGYAEFAPVFKFEFDYDKPSVDWGNLEIERGELKKFKFWSDETKFDFKTVLNCDVSNQVEVEEIKKLFSNVIKTSFKFMVGPVPVYISIDCDIYGKYNLNFSSQLEASVGFQSTRYITLGVLYENSTWSKFSDFRKEDTFLEPQLSGQANLSQRLEIYPHFDIKLYKILGPNLDVVPFVYNECNVDLSGNWDARLDLGIDLRIGAEVEVLGNNILSYQSGNLNLYTNTVWEASNLDDPVILLTPVNGAILDNGCENSNDLIEWYFDWIDFPSAQKYHLYVIGANATYPVIDDAEIQNSEYLSSDYAYIIPSNANDWTWKVRAFVNDEWTEWSEIRTFDVEPINTDCN